MVGSMKLHLCLILFLSLLFTSCVSKKKYSALQNAKTRLDNEVLRLQEIETDYATLQKKYLNLKQDYEEAHKNLMALSTKFSNLKNSHAALQSDYEALLQNNKLLLENASEKTAELSEKLAQKQETLTHKENQLRQLSLQLEKKEKNLNNIKASLQEREERIQSLQEKLNRQKQVLKTFHENLTRALLDFPKDDLTIERKNGKIYVSLSQNLLFAKGSDKLDPQGIDALKKLAEVLKKNKSFHINVQGHTDNDGSASLNWKLSTERALSVIEVLQNSGVNPERLTASGRAFYDPLVPNTSRENKALNRRTEIIISPDLNSLYEILNNNKIGKDTIR